MCEKPSRLTYSPRRLAWCAAEETGGGGTPAGSGGAGDSGGQGAGPTGGGGKREPDFSPDAALRNWRQPMPLGRKIRIGVKNIGIKIRTGQTCCGNYGEPGC